MAIYDIINNDIASVVWFTLFNNNTIDVSVNLFYNIWNILFPKLVVFNCFPTYLGSTKSLIKQEYRFHKRWEKNKNNLDYCIFSRL